MATINDRDVYIVGCVRTPIGRGYANGALHEAMPVELLAATLKEVVARAGVSPSAVEDVICGVVTPVKSQGANIPRLAALVAGFPVSVPGVQLNRMCGSGQQAVHFASQAIKSGDMDIVIAAGVEMMSVVPMASDWQLDERFSKIFPYKAMHQGVSAELISEKWKLTRDELDKISGQSHERAAEAQKKGYFKREIMPITVKKADGSSVVVDSDEGIRVPVDYAKMKTLKTPFKAGGLITPANASQISDGAAAVLLASGKKVKELGLKARARIVSTATVGSDPELMLTGPIPATQLALKKGGLNINQIDLFEINEAFASVVLAWMKDLKPDPAKVNPNGGAIAMGHPLGASGAILMTKMVHELERAGGRYGLQTMCIGHGQATATIIENINAKPKAKL
jgi:acetyl-CoA acetyltransferase family protein